MPRIKPITGKADVSAEHHAVVDAVEKIFGGVRGPFSMLLHSPKLAERLLPLVTFFRDGSVVDAKLRLATVTVSYLPMTVGEWQGETLEVEAGRLTGRVAGLVLRADPAIHLVVDQLGDRRRCASWYRTGYAWR